MRSSSSSSRSPSSPVRKEWGNQITTTWREGWRESRRQGRDVWTGCRRDDHTTPTSNPARRGPFGKASVVAVGGGSQRGRRRGRGRALTPLTEIAKGVLCMPRMLMSCTLRFVGGRLTVKLAGRERERENGHRCRCKSSVTSLSAYSHTYTPSYMLACLCSRGGAEEVVCPPPSYSPPRCHGNNNSRRGKSTAPAPYQSRVTPGLARVSRVGSSLRGEGRGDCRHNGLCVRTFA